MLCLYQNCGSKGFLLAGSWNTWRPQCTLQTLVCFVPSNEQDKTWIYGQSNKRKFSWWRFFSLSVALAPVSNSVYLFLVASLVWTRIGHMSNVVFVECDSVVVVGLSRVGTRWIVARPDGPTAIPTFKRRQPVGVLQPFKILQLATCNYAKKIGISINDSCNNSCIHPFCRRKRACRVWSINSLFFHFPISCWISYMDLAIQWCVSFCDT